MLLLSGALVLGGIVSRLGQSPLIGYLIAGMLMGGPGSFHFVKSEHEIEGIAELGVSLLLFSLGLEFSVKRLRSLGGRILSIGVLQVVLTSILGAGGALLFGFESTESVAIGAMISLSSTAVVLRTLMERAEMETGHGRVSLAVLLIQDMAVVPLAILVSLLGEGGTAGEVAMRVGTLLGMAAGLTVALYVILNVIAVYALGMLTQERNRELTILLAVVTGLGSAWAAHHINISPALGAFVAGMFLGSSPFATQIRADVSSLRVVLLTLFFGAAGMVADPLWILPNFHLVAFTTLLILLGKIVIITLIARMMRAPWRMSLASGLCLGQIGEFAFVLGSIAINKGVISNETNLLIVSSTIVSLMVSPFLIPNARSLSNMITRTLGLKAPSHSDDGHADHACDIVLIGYGPAGQLAVESIPDKVERILVIDLSQKLLRKARERGMHTHLGDATQMDVLEHAHVASAKTILITIPSYHSAMIILDHVREMAPGAHVVVRSRYQRHTHELVDRGAEVVLGDEEEIGQAIGRHLAKWLDDPSVSPKDTLEVPLPQVQAEFESFPSQESAT